MREIFLTLKFTLVDTFCKDQLNLALYYTSHWVERGKMKGLVNCKTSLKTPVLKELSWPQGLALCLGRGGSLHLITATPCPSAVLLLFFSRGRCLSGAPDKESGCGLFTYFNGGRVKGGWQRYTCIAMISPAELSHSNLFPERFIRENDLKVHYCHRQRG